MVVGTPGNARPWPPHALTATDDHRRLRNAVGLVEQNGALNRVVCANRLATTSTAVAEGGRRAVGHGRPETRRPGKPAAAARKALHHSGSWGGRRCAISRGAVVRRAAHTQRHMPGAACASGAMLVRSGTIRRWWRRWCCSGGGAHTDDLRIGAATSSLPAAPM